MQDLIYTVMLLAAFQGAVLCVVLAGRSRNRLANRILAALVGALALMLFLGYLDRRWGFGGYPHFIALGTPLPYLFSPLLYLYVTALTKPLDALHPRSMVHGTPFAANVVFMTMSFYIKSGADKLAIAERFVDGKVETAMYVMEAVMIVQAASYMVACVVILHHYRRRIRGFFSDIHRIDLRWLTVLVWSNGIGWGIVASSFVLQFAEVGAGVVEGLRAIIGMASSLIVFVIGYMALWQPELFESARLARLGEPGTMGALPSATSEPQSPSVSDSESESESESDPESESESEPESEPESESEPDLPAAPKRAAAEAKYQRNRLEAAEAAEIAADLAALVQAEQPYRDPGLTLQMLADAVGVPPHTLSQVLNVHVNQSFYAYTNGLRVVALKASLAQPELRDQGVLQLAFDAGFSSKSTTNSVFKKHTGVTPSQFRKRALAEDSAETSVG